MIALLLAPGAGSNRDHSSLLAIEARLAPIPVARMDFPYRKAGRKAPDRPPVLLEAVRAEAASLIERAKPSGLVLGGRSMGGRICSMAVADGLVPAVGLALISYPLHPPGKPEQLRTAHLPHLHVPCLFIHGTKDPFGTPDELTEATAAIPGRVEHCWIDGGRHDLAWKDDVIVETIAAFIATL